MLVMTTVMVRMMMVSMKMMVGEKFSFDEEKTMMIVWVMIIIMFQQTNFRTCLLRHLSLFHFLSCFH